jgi:hypothetical protein
MNSIFAFVMSSIYLSLCSLYIYQFLLLPFSKRKWFKKILINWKFRKIREIDVVKNFEIENGVLGLERDVYLSIVKFLDSSILRKV